MPALTTEHKVRFVVVVNTHTGPMVCGTPGARAFGTRHAAEHSAGRIARAHPAWGTAVCAVEPEPVP